MLLVFDVGNTHIKLGLYDETELRAYWRIATDRHRLADEYAVTVHSLFESRMLDWRAVDGVALASSVPPLVAVFTELSRSYLNCEPVVVGPGMKTGVRLLIDNPREVGPDRVVNALAAFRLHGGPAIVVDFGTGLNFDVVSEAGEFLGGSIAPGFGIAADALFRYAARLTQVEFVRPPRAIGKNTVHALQSGLIFGYVGLVEGIVRRIEAELEQKAVVIATGGLSEVIAAESDVIDVIEPNLTLEGLRMVYWVNQTQA
ncbi:MAG TPA: type III pantothenate kinase [Herpetosiphonaceae bacterium]|nr:type III pantothenate kinase [Herpetosiphonaceae bacterium]